MEKDASNKLIVALDKATLGETESLIKELQGVVSYFKVGFELFTAHGWKAVELVQKSGAKVFLDMKYHDIPNTVAKAMRVVADHGVDMVNLHASGGFQMMRSAADALKEKEAEGKKKPLLIAVTVLTSLSQKEVQEDLGIDRPVREHVLHLSKLAARAGLDGVVCSPEEIEDLRTNHSDNFCIVTPGIRPAGSAAGDQTRICTPEEACRRGSSYLVIGRPITGAEDPGNAARTILQQMA